MNENQLRHTWSKQGKVIETVGFRRLAQAVWSLTCILSQQLGRRAKGLFESEDSLNGIGEGSGAHRERGRPGPEGPQGRAKVVFSQMRARSALAAKGGRHV
jgi:hypothetical protein